MHIRIATEEDFHQLILLKEPKDEHHKEQARYRAEKRLKETAEGIATYLVAEEDNIIVGHVFLKFYGTNREAYFPDIEDLYIHSTSRGKGIGTALLQKCENIAKEKEYLNLFLSVNPTKNSCAKKLYEKFGFKDMGKPPYVDGVYDGVEDVVIDMEKVFTRSIS